MAKAKQTVVGGAHGGMPLNGSEQNLQSTHSVADAALSRESILCTEELKHRPSRSPDYEKENRALVALAQALADSPHTILQRLADTMLEVFQCDSAGVSLLTTNDGGKRFYWPAIAGMWKPNIGGGTPRDFGPCGDVLDRNAPLLFSHVERFYTYFQSVTPPVEECLLVPFYVQGKAVGTIWAVAHDERRKFDAEDLRQLVSLAQFASAAYQAVASLDLQALSVRLMQTQDDERRRISRELHDSVGQKLVAAKLALGSLRKPTATKKENQDLASLRDALDECVTETRTISYLLHPPLLDEVGLSSAARWYAEGFAKRSGIQVGFRIPPKLKRLPGPLELALFRVLQESLTNVHRHSHSTSVDVHVELCAGEISLEVQDYGQGMPAELFKRFRSGGAGAGVGLSSMRERISELGGRFEIQSDENGTLIRATLPLSDATKKSEQHIPQTRQDRVPKTLF